MVSCAIAFALHSGDRVVFYGDSITEQRHYSTLVEAFVATRYPKLNISFFNRGWGGDSSWGGGGGTPQDRIQKDVAPLNPTQIFVMLGMNDGGYLPYDPKIDSVIHEWYPKLLDLIQKACPGANFTLARTSPWDDFAHSYTTTGKPPEPWAPWQGYNDVLKKYGLIAKEESEKRNGRFVDFNEPLSHILEQAAKKDMKIASQIIPDGIHPSAAGGLSMAAELLKVWHAEPIVSAVWLDAKDSKVRSHDRTIISNFKDLYWTQLDESLPFAYDLSDEATKVVSEIADFRGQLNRQTLRVSNLPAGNYDLVIDKVQVGAFSADELEHCVEISELETPMRKQALKVLDLCAQRGDIEFFAWRKIQRDLPASETSQAAYDQLMHVVENQRLEIMRAATPKQHQFQLFRK